MTFRRRVGGTRSAVSTTVSCEGASIVVPRERADAIQRGERVNVGVAIDGDILSLPAIVTWVEPHGDDGGVHIGLKLMLPLADAATRYAYADWIVDQTRASRRRATTQGDQNHRVVQIDLTGALRV